MNNKNKFWLPYTAIAGAVIYSLFWILKLIKNPLLISYEFKDFVIFLIVVVLTWIFYRKTINQPSWIQTRGLFLKIYLQLFSLFVIFYFPLAWYDLTSSGWFSGLGAIIYAVIGIPLFLIIGGVFAFILKKHQPDQPHTITGVIAAILCIVTLSLFVSHLYGFMRPLSAYEKPQPVLKDISLTDLEKTYVESKIREKFNEEWGQVSDGCGLNTITSIAKMTGGYTAQISYGCGFVRADSPAANQKATVKITNSGTVTGVPKGPKKN